jgi:hypothetical protein
MGKVRIRDDAIWAKHIEGDPRLAERIKAMSEGQPIDLEVNGIVGRWQRMRDGKDGRPTLGIKPIAEMKDVWARFRREASGKVVDVREVRIADSYLASVEMTLSEWDSPEDETAYRDLPIR